MSKATENTLVSVGVDWITVTQPKKLGQAFLETAARRWLAVRKAEGFTAKGLSWMGYLGEAIDGLSYGTRPDGLLLRLSGDLARTNAAFAFQFAGNVTRLDLQATILEPAPWCNRAREAYTVAGMDRRIVSGMTRTSLISSTPAGATCYVGSRSSDRMFRVYDKAAESGGIHAVGTWRYEIEYKADRALRVAEHLAKNKWSPAATLDVVVGAFNDYHITVPVPTMGSNWRDTSPVEETDDQKRLAWLRDSIAPAVAKLCEAFDHATVLEALGLDTNFVNRETGEVTLEKNQK